MPEVVKQLEGNRVASLHLAIVDEDGRPVLGNVFVVVCHEGSGQKWRGLRYSLKAKAYYYRDLPTGSFSISVSAAGYRAARRDLSLGPGENQRVEVKLAPEPGGDALILDTGAELETYQGFVGELYHRRDLSERFRDAPAETLRQYLSDAGGGALAPRPALSQQATILAALINDARTIDALTQPTRTYSPDALAEWVESQLVQAWEFRAPEFMLDRVIGPVVECRVRLLTLVRAVMSHPYLRALAPGLDDAAVTAHMLRFLASLDTPQLDGVIPILIQIMDPSLAPVERFARGLLSTFDARVPVGSATLRAEGAQALDDAPATFGAGIEEICNLLLQQGVEARAAARLAKDDADVRERASTVTFVLADIAKCMAAALDPAPLFIASIRTEGVYA